MKPLAVVRSLAIGLFAFAIGCSGAEPTELEGDMPETIDDTATELAAEPEPDDGAAGDNDGDADDDHDKRDGRRKHKRKHRHHHLFKKLDRLDGTKDHQITIAALPPRVPAKLVDKLHEIDANADGVVTREESHDYCKTHGHRFH